MNDIEAEDKGKGNEELPGIPDDQDQSDLRIIPITNSASHIHSPDWTVEHEDYDFDIQNGDEFDQVVADFNNIALTEQGGANHPDAQARREDQMDTVDVDW